MIKPAKAYQLVCDFVGEKKKTEDVVRSHTDAWYKILRSTGHPPYEIYAEKDYLFDMADCFKHYSYGYVREISEYLVKMNIRKIVDYGAGLGATTANIRSILPKAQRVIYSNLPANPQWYFAEWLFKHYPEPIEMFKEEDLASLGKVDCCVAFEFFEHFQEPVVQLEKIVKTLSPEIIIHASSFSIDSVGHFDSYKIGERILSKRKTMASFKEALRDFGYKQKETNFWCDRPQVWEGKNAQGIL